MNDVASGVPGVGFACVRWRWVVPAGVVAGLVPQLLTLLSVYAWAVALVFLLQGATYFPGFVPSSVHTVAGVAPAPQFVLEGAEWNEEIRRFAYAMAVFGQPLMHLICAGVAASAVVRKVETAPLRHGLFVGLVSVVGTIGYLLAGAFLSEIVYGTRFYGVLEALDYGDISPIGYLLLSIYLPLGGLTLYSILGVAGGLLGGLEGRAVLAEREAIYRASRDVSVARRPQEIAISIGENLADPEIEEITLWEPIPESAPAELSLAGSWTRAGRPGSLDWRLDASRLPGSARLERRSSLSVRTRELPTPEREAWEGRGARSVLFVPLVFPGGRRAPGLLAVASRKGWGFSGAAVRAYLTTAAQAAAVLENLLLAEEARQAGVLRERHRLAQEIHDTLAQGFTSVVTNLEAAEGTLPPLPEPARRHLDGARLAARENLKEARRLVWAARPEPLEDSSLPEALRGIAERWSRESGIDADASATGTPRRLPVEIEATLLRVAQEALANVRKHARASRAALTLSYVGERVALDVRDDGVGFDPTHERAASPEGGFGLRGMRKRIERLGGTLTVESEPGEGTTLVAELPVAEVGPATKSAETMGKAP